MKQIKFSKENLRKLGLKIKKKFLKFENFF
jgi:hypothetical protein